MELQISSIPIMLEYLSALIQRIKQNSITADEINKQFKSYWWNPYLYKDEIAFLPQTPIYSFGNEIFGCIYDTFGIEILFE